SQDLVLDALDKRQIGEDAIISCRDSVYRAVDELRAISDHVLGATGVQIPEDVLDNLQLVIEVETLELDPQDLLGSILLGTCLALEAKATPVEESTGVLESMFSEVEVSIDGFADFVICGVRLTCWLWFFGVTATGFVPSSAILGQ
nr:hypothetical protein [Tanacetum cinerariifolium]